MFKKSVKVEERMISFQHTSHKTKMQKAKESKVPFTFIYDYKQTIFIIFFIY